MSLRIHLVIDLIQIFIFPSFHCWVDWQIHFPRPVKIWWNALTGRPWHQETSKNLWKNRLSHRVFTVIIPWESCPPWRGQSTRWQYLKHISKKRSCYNETLAWVSLNPLSNGFRRMGRCCSNHPGKSNSSLNHMVTVQMQRKGEAWRAIPRRRNHRTRCSTGHAGYGRKESVWIPDLWRISYDLITLKD